MSYKDIKEAGKDLLALTLNGSPRWRLMVMAAILALSCAAVYGNQTYARKDEMGGLKSEVTDIKVQLLAQSILAAHKEKCESESAGKFSSYWQEHLAKLKNQYWRLTGQTFELPPSC
jgi:uncharacterized membrane protein YraQ (UPF0718 family)